MKTMQSKKTRHSLLSYCFTWRDYQKLAGFVLHLNLTQRMALWFHLFLGVWNPRGSSHPCFWYNYYLFSLDIRKLKAALATPLDFGDGDNDMDVDTGSEMSAAQAPKKVNATSVKMVYQESDSENNGKFNLGNKIRTMCNGYYLVSIRQELWYHRMLRDLNQGTIFFIHPAFFTWKISFANKSVWM